jgi:hypothetical protein
LKIDVLLGRRVGVELVIQIIKEIQDVLLADEDESAVGVYWFGMLSLSLRLWVSA